MRGPRPIGTAPHAKPNTVSSYGYPSGTTPAVTLQKPTARFAPHHFRSCPRKLKISGRKIRMNHPEQDGVQFGMFSGGL